MDNLQNMTYQTFEQDPVKYERYEEVSTPSLCGALVFLMLYMYRRFLELS